jgi:hypothetical protein
VNDDQLSEDEQYSLHKALYEAREIKEGKLKALSFDELWEK